MEAQELRIGNWVLHSNGEVFYIDCKWIYQFSSGKQELSIIKPIPLTEEWLVKFRFVKNDCDNYELEYTFKLNASFTIINKDRGYFYIDAPNHEIKYVHQLQNIFFALTGEELTI